MVRKYIRKTHIGSTSADVMKEAAVSVISREKSLYNAAQHFDIPKTTLLRYVKKLRQESTVDNVAFRPNYGVRQILSVILLTVQTVCEAISFEFVIKDLGRMFGLICDYDLYGCL
jgi:hypothetical protein